MTNYGLAESRTFYFFGGFGGTVFALLSVRPSVTLVDCMSTNGRHQTLLTVSQGSIPTIFFLFFFFPFFFFSFSFFLFSFDLISLFPCFLVSLLLFFFFSFYVPDSNKSTYSICHGSRLYVDYVCRLLW